MQRKYLLALLMLSYILFFSPQAYAQTQANLVVDYRSGTEAKVVVVNELDSQETARVYSESELNTFPSYNTYYFAATLAGNKSEYHTVEGISMWEVFANAGIPEEVYRGDSNHLYTVSRDGAETGQGKVVGMGKDIKIPVSPIPTDSGLLSATRYTYLLEDFLKTPPQNQQEIPWILGLKQGKIEIVEKDKDYTAATADDSTLAVGAYFGKTGKPVSIQANGLLFNNKIYRLVLSDSLLTDEEARNDSSSTAFTLFGTAYDRANMLSGPKGEGEKIKGHFTSGTDTLFIEGTAVASLLPTPTTESYVTFTYGAGAHFSVPVNELSANNYTLVYASGSGADQLNPIKRQIGNATYYFDLYYNSGRPIYNITDMELSSIPAEEEVLRIYQGMGLIHSFTDSSIGMLQGLSNLKYSANDGQNRQEYMGVAGISLAELLLSSGVTITEDNTLVRVENSQGEYREFTAKQLLNEACYYYGAGAQSSSENAPALINFDQADDGGRFYIGQASATEPTAYALLENMRGGSITIGGLGGQHGQVQAQPNGGKISRGAAIELTGAVGESKIYYTLDGSIPTLSSAFYRPGTFISAPSATQFELKARIIGFGKEEGPILSIEYNSGITNTGSNSNSGSGSSSGSDSDADTSPQPEEEPIPDPNTAETLLQATTAAANSNGTSSGQGKQVASNFTDVKEDSYYYESLNYAVEKGLFNGFNDGSFQPEQVLTRAMSATELWRLAESPLGGESAFTDVNNADYFAAAVAWAAEQNLVQGDNQGNFAPNEEISREQFALIMYRYAHCLGYSPQTTTELPGYADSEAVSAYALEAMAWAVEIGLIKGVSADLLDPQAPLNRAQAAVILHRFALWMENNPTANI